MITLVDPPGSDVIEVSVFGPGVGESILVHLGDGNWLIVDSCIDGSDADIPALRYLDEIGLDPATAVRLIVASHAHDDHTAGMSRIVERCPAAPFVCSSALTTDEFFQTMKLDQDFSYLIRQSAHAEYRNIFQIVRRKGRTAEPPVMRAFPNRELLAIPDASNEVARVLALSPSDQAVTRSIDALARHVASQRGKRRKLSSFDPNEASVALWIETLNKRILLGADMLRGPANCGWQAVLGTFKPKDGQKAEVFKVAHHGSPGADHDDIWKDLLIANPVVVVTPYWRGAVNLPSMADRVRISSRTTRAFITAYREPKSPRSVKRVAAEIGQLGTNVRPVPVRCGQVRARSKVGEDRWTVDTLAPARPLNALRSSRMLRLPRRR